jgi:hypothetical protein
MNSIEIPFFQKITISFDISFEINKFQNKFLSQFKNIDIIKLSLV